MGSVFLYWKLMPRPAVWFWKKTLVDQEERIHYRSISGKEEDPAVASPAGLLPAPSSIDDKGWFRPKP